MAKDSSTRVLNTPELVALLAPHVGKCDLVRLAYTSRGCFSSSISLVWRELQGVHKLFALIPGAKCEKYGGTSLDFDLGIPDLKTADLSRFMFYAPFVYSLEVFPRGGATYLFSDWNKLNKYTKSTVLLPNLQSLAFGSWNYGGYLVDWLTPFLSPKVRQIHAHSLDSSYHIPIMPNEAAILFNAVFKHCPEITDLSFFPIEVDSTLDRDYDTNSSYSYDSKPDNDGEDATGITATNTLSEDLTASRHRDLGPRLTLPGLNDFMTPSTGAVPFYELLRHAHWLQNLATTAYMLRPEVLGAIGALPNLQSISVFFDLQDINLSSFDYSKLRTDTFPSLRALRLNLPKVDDIRYIWKIKPLVRHLVDLTVELRGGSSLSVDRIHNNYFMSFIPAICEQSPSIQSLTLDFGGAQEGAQTVLPLKTLTTLASLPLETLFLRNVRLGEVRQVCQVLAQSHSLRNLYTPSQKVDYDDLLYFSRISGLECLHAEVLWNDPSRLRKHLSGPLPESSSDIRFLQCSTPPQLGETPETNAVLIQGIIMWLYTRLPNLEEVSHVDPADPDDVDSTYDLFNGMIERLRKGWEPLVE